MYKTKANTKAKTTAMYTTKTKAIAKAKAMYKTKAKTQPKVKALYTFYKKQIGNNKPKQKQNRAVTKKMADRVAPRGLHRNQVKNCVGTTVSSVGTTF